MKKIKSIKHNKIWGYEIWVYSPLKGMETPLEDNTLPNKGPLVKIIKTIQPLSIQVHPDDKFAQELENQPNGKSESWYILDHKPNARVVMGIKNFDKKIIQKKLTNGTFEEELIFQFVNKGDFFNIPAGLIHGIGAGNTILEVQQPSDITYRYFDYNRLENNKPRELHIAKAIKVQKQLNWNLKPISQKPLTYKNDVGVQIYMKQPTTIYKQAIIVDLTTYNSYLGEKNDYINFYNYVIISL